MLLVRRPRDRYRARYSWFSRANSRANSPAKSTEGGRDFKMPLRRVGFRLRAERAK